MKNNSKNTAKLSEKTKIKFEQACKAEVMPINPNASDLIAIAKRLKPILEEDLKFVEKCELLSSEQVPFLVYENIPVDSNLPEPPVNGKRPPDKLSWVSEITQLSILMLSGYTPFSFIEEKGDELIHQIAPATGKENTKSNGGKIKLPWHTDESILPYVDRPQVLLLSGLINESSIGTSISVASDAIEYLTKSEMNTLMGNNFRIETPDSFDDYLKGMKILSAWMPILRFDENGVLRANGNLHSVKSKNRQARKALEALMFQLTLTQKSVVLKPGVAIGFNNSLCFHQRGKIGSGKRWLQRVFGTKNIDHIRAFFNADNETFIFDAHKLVLGRI